ncbi:AAA domain-containing protein [Ectobacillus ponti]|uniref:AAA domain-containing protein n=1 Tax=Ectobacillus ponti TaxID=2961894 RepID=A0AA42BPD2_9BACI|nr:AAA domain-containing protein [Ectobacillus ponti]MCP8968995.1 AAA domain-containing protein [Ectobacillus ponti]
MSAGKVERLFQYLIAVNDLGSKVIRRYQEYDFTLLDTEIEEAENCSLFQSEQEEVWLEVRKVYISSEEETPPPYPLELAGWLADDPKDYKKAVIRVKDEQDGELFAEKEDRAALYADWLEEWQSWKEELAKKQKAKKIYDDFFRLYQRFEREGERLELVFGAGILTWRKTEAIEHPVLTVRMELEFSADQGAFLIKPSAGGIQTELEALSGYPIPNATKIQDMADAWRELEPNAAAFTELEQDFVKFIHLLDAEGKYVPNDDVSIRQTPQLFNRCLFMLREKNQRVLKKDLQQILEKTQSGELFPPASIRSLVGESTAHDAGNSHEWEGVGHELYFPMPANEDQREIARRIARSYGVSVQGPPGTGKSHTIANLVSHLLAHGKKVLITSQKESPLRVLRDKIPQDIQSLCVPVLGGSRDSLREVEKSVQAISENLGSMDIDRLGREIETAKAQLDASKRREAAAQTKLKQYELREQETLHWEGKQILRADAARLLRENTVPFDWIQDDLPASADMPLSAQEFQQLWQLRGELSPADYRLLLYALPEGIPTAEEFQDLLADGAEREKRMQAAGEGLAFDLNIQLDREYVTSMLTALEYIMASRDIFASKAYTSILQDVESGGVRRETWEEFVRDTEEAIGSLLRMNRELQEHEISLPAKPLFELKQQVAKAKEAFGQGKPGMLYFMLKGKDVKYLFKEPVINKKPVTAAAEFDVLEMYLQFQEQKEKLLRKWNNSMEPIGGMLAEEAAFINKIDNELQQIRRIFAVHEKIEAFRSACAEVLPILKWDELQTYESLKAAFRHASEQISLAEWQASFEKQRTELAEGGKRTDAHEMWTVLLQAWDHKDTAAWQQATQALENLQRIHGKATVLSMLVAKLQEAAPQTAAWIEEQLGADLPMPAWTESWSLRTLDCWLHDLDSLDADELAEELKQERLAQQRLTEEIVAKSSWRNQLDSITEEQKRALSAWKTYITRYGKGTGKNAAMNLREAQKEMAKCQAAIPVWIMPIQQVLENFPVTNEPFDVVIVDESSQCNIMSLPVLMRAKRVIVVGDDEQISPYDIGVQSDAITHLVQQFLQGIPNARLFDLQISLYDIADQIFPKAGRLMLKEHFRCVPEIIQFSNDLSYHGKMVPLRLPTQAEIITPPVLAVRVEDGYCSNGTEAVNAPEAERIVADVVAMVKDPVYADQTIGIVTLQGNKQHELIEALLRNAVGERTMLERKIRCGNAYAFQGDERDIMLLSMVIAPNRRFTSLTKKNFQQIFNVAASRARNQMRLYHSVGLEELKTDDLRHRLLAYCQNPARVQQKIEDLEAACDSPFEVEVLRRIRAKGFRVVPQVKVAGRRIDLVVEGLRNRLAVECDGEKFHPLEKWEEDMERQYMLERLGWTFWRVRGRDFYQDPDRAMEGLWRKLEEMGIMPYEEKLPPAEAAQPSRQEQFVPEEPAPQQTYHERLADLVAEQKQYLHKKPFRATHLRKSGIEVEAVVFADEAGEEHVLYRSENHIFRGPLPLAEFMETSTAIPSKLDRAERKAPEEKPAAVAASTASKQKPAVEATPANFAAYLRQEGYKMIDHRDKGGALWVIGGSQLEPLFKQLEQQGVRFRYMPSGTKSTSNLPGWYLVGDTAVSVKPIVRQKVEEDDKELRFGNETLYISPRLQKRKIDAADFPGCQTMVRGLKRVYDIEYIGNLPSKGDSWHDGIRGVGIVTARRFWDHLVRLVQREER